MPIFSVRKLKEWIAVFKIVMLTIACFVAVLGLLLECLAFYLVVYGTTEENIRITIFIVIDLVVLFVMMHFFGDAGIEE